MDYLVTPPDETDWRMDPADFEAALRERWPAARVRATRSDPTYALDFAVDVEGGEAEGSFARDGQMLGLLHDVYLCAEVAAWFRSVVPAEQPLLFWDPALNGHVELRGALAPRELAEAYLASEAA
jgi:hypothetical protein